MCSDTTYSKLRPQWAYLAVGMVANNLETETKLSHNKYGGM